MTVLTLSLSNTPKVCNMFLQIAPLKQKLAKLQSGTVLITKEDRDAVEKVALYVLFCSHLRCTGPLT